MRLHELINAKQEALHLVMNTKGGLFSDKARELEQEIKDLEAITEDHASDVEKATCTDSQREELQDQGFKCAIEQCTSEVERILNNENDDGKIYLTKFALESLLRKSFEKLEYAE